MKMVLIISVIISFIIIIIGGYLLFSWIVEADTEGVDYNLDENSITRSQQGINQKVCYDSDGGEKRYIKGTIEPVNEVWKINEDTCAIKKRSDDSLENLIKQGEIIPVSACYGDGCFLMELYCLFDRDSYFSDMSCEHGCQDGVCLQKSNEKVWDNKVYESNIGDLEYFDTDTEESECYWFKENGNCHYYKADYGKKVGSLTHIYSGFIESHDSIININDFILNIKSKYPDAKKDNFLNNDYYILEIKHGSGTSINILWVSEHNVLTVGALDKYDDSSEEIKNLLGIYLPKYPSNLNLD
jgi:hypothetical protein